MGFTLCPNLIYYENICNGIGTDVGKTIASSITESLQADYWKPIQAGDLDNSDSHKIQRYISNDKTVIHPNS
jgi:dethiobiotin synthetase